MANYPKFKAAAVQAAPVFFNLDATIEKTCNLVDEAASNGAVISNTLPHDVEGIVYADVDLEQIIPGKFLIDTAGHYSTPGFLSLSFDRTPHTPVKKIGDTPPKP